MVIVDEELLVVAGERSVFFHEVNNGTYAQVAYHSLPPDSQILGTSIFRFHSRQHELMHGIYNITYFVHV